MLSTSFDFSEIIISLAAALIALSFHEFAHGFVAYKLGDPTAKAMGRLSINPLSHIDPLGAICMVLFHFGWAKPVPIDPRNFKNPKRDFALTAIAGPATNVILGFISSFLYVLFLNLYRTVGVSSEILFVRNFLYFTALFFMYCLIINVGLGIFNLIPIPPFDGSRLLNALLPQRLYFKIMKYERRIYWGVIAWLLLGTYVYRALVSIPFIAANPVLSGIASIFSLSGLISNATSFIANGMVDLWLLIPAFSGLA